MIQEKPKVSIIIPVYNGAKYVHEAIQSALAQTYPNIEVIVVNDGSIDDTERIALSYGDRIRYFHKENGGVSTALNKGIENMTGTYFSWLSHDDVYTQDKIEKQMELLKELDPKTILYGGYELINEKSEKLGEVNPSIIHPEQKLNIPLFPLLRGLINGCTLLIHKSHFELVGLFDPSLRSTQDYDLWYKMFRNAKIKYHRGLYVKSRSHQDQGTNTMPKHEDDCSKLWIYMMDNLTPEEMVDMDGSVYSFRINTYLFLKENTPYKGAIRQAEELYNNAKEDLDKEINNLKVSVIVPFYNRIPLLVKSINSVLSQTHKNLEILLIDDGSTDDFTPINELIEKDKRIKYFSQENKGCSAARNFGINKADGEFIAFLDSDDLFLRDKLKIQLEHMVKNGFDFSHTSYQKIGIDDKMLEVINSGLFSGAVFPRIISSCGIATPTVMIRKKVLKDLRFNEKFNIGEDTCFWIDLAYRHQLGGIDQPLSLVRVSDTSAAYNLDKQKIGLLNIVYYVVNNPVYALYQRDIALLLNDLTLLFNRSSELNEAIEGDQQFDSSFPPPISKPRSKVKRLFISLGYDGLRITIRKILYKFRLKFFNKNFH